MDKIRAGVGHVLINPPMGIYLIGMERFNGSHGLRDDLYATTLVLSDGASESVLVSPDVLFIHPQPIRRVSEQVEAYSHIPGQNLMLYATHYHSRPAVCTYLDNRLASAWPFRPSGVCNGSTNQPRITRGNPLARFWAKLIPTIGGAPIEQSKVLQGRNRQPLVRYLDSTQIVICNMEIENVAP
jgi:hypothetical protein